MAVPAPEPPVDPAPAPVPGPRGVPDARAAAPAPLVRLPDGTVKQVSPLTGTVVWTVPGRAERPVPTAPVERRHLDPARRDRLCAFCAGRYAETPPERARLVAGPEGPRVLTGLPASRLTATVAEVRRIPNLYAVLPTDYWRTNHGYVPGPEVLERVDAYLAEPEGRMHVMAVLARREASAGRQDSWLRSPADQRRAAALELFAGAHDLVVARRHVVDGARFEDELAGAGTLTPDEHHAYVAMTVEGLRDVYERQPHARYVVAFQNWLRPAGASFDHLHKQLVAVDEPGPQVAHETRLVRRDPDVYQRLVHHARAEGLVVARNLHAVAVAGVGHPFPSLEVYPVGRPRQPWEHSADELRGVSDLLHALHAATGPTVPTNEEWHHRPPGVDAPLRWRVVLAWRVSTPAGFEGGTGIHVSTVDPWTVRERVVGALRGLRDAGLVAPVQLGDEAARGPLTLLPPLRPSGPAPARTPRGRAERAPAR
ncbi:DUF4921 family protein [Cellulomonas marina]|uniref:Galactose-1-phosphate uridylyltransferase n=1 Tax=Cellulomonas marina TaxID=988821 RepID=A0A1I0WUK0_9CELL|nr:DUF4921 family protein [Cellulomonas marina]GIG27855.1 hypothetical protein Cma02nite_04550 [Cellulomonas marina]SFA91633.1 Galactose-1-phosphate uridylyltransferase [Cellulomonas marina]